MKSIGRYVISEAIARGGMGTVHVGRLLGSVGFRRLVAIKRVHPALASDPHVVRRFRREATLAGRILHPSVVATFDVIAEEAELFLVMELVRGESLAQLMSGSRARGEAIPVAIASAIIVSVLAGLSAAHTANDEAGRPLGLVHLDVSPQNMLVGVDGLGRVVDFGIAQSALDSQRETAAGNVRGKPRYLAPEQLGYDVGKLDGRTDCFAACVVLWEALAGRPLWTGESTAEVVEQILGSDPPPLRDLRDDVPAALDAVLARGLQRDPAARFDSAAELAAAIEASTPGLASQRAIGAWVSGLAGGQLASIDQSIQALEQPRSDDELDLDGPTVSLEASPPPTSEEHATPRRAAVRRVLIDEAADTRSLTIDLTQPAVGPETQARAATPVAQVARRSWVPATLLLVALLTSAVGLGWWQGRQQSPLAPAGATTQALGASPESSSAALVAESAPEASSDPTPAAAVTASASAESSAATPTPPALARRRPPPRAASPSAGKQAAPELGSDPLGKPYIADRP